MNKLILCWRERPAREHVDFFSYIDCAQERDARASRGIIQKMQNSKQQ